MIHRLWAILANGFAEREERRKEAQRDADRREYERGYAWAQAELAAGTDPADIDAYAECSRHFADYTYYDIGLEAATRDYRAARRKNEGR